MSKGIVAGVTGTLSLLLLLFFKGAEVNAQEHSFRLLFYNVENLFDIYDDPLKDDDEFLPGGTRRWNLKRYNSKLNSVYKAITAAGEWSPPPLIALCEIENRKVLEDLLYRTNFRKFDYGILHEDSPDTRGIDVCLIFRQDLIEIIDYCYFTAPELISDDFATRSILYASCLFSGDTIHFFINHWPSRRGGVLAGEPKRQIIAEMIRNKIDSIAADKPHEVKIIVVGDFNTSPGDKVMKKLTFRSDSLVTLINLSDNLATGSGTYKYRGIWEMPDQVIVSDALLNCRKGICTGKDNFRIFDQDFLLMKDPGYPGLQPYSTWRAYNYLGGYSDHLPVILDLKVR
ncbi:MAG: endonuclease [Bacteroidales bacterium]|nr:endonuclease [Bacteroidales bacterium]